VKGSDTKEYPAVWLQAAGCSGCSVSVLNATNPAIENLITTARQAGETSATKELECESYSGPAGKEAFLMLSRVKEACQVAGSLGRRSFEGIDELRRR